MHTAPERFLRRDKPAPPGPTQVALYGRDEALLHYRNQVLCWAGFSTRMILAPPKEVSPAAVTLFCHTLTPEDRETIYRQVKQRDLSSKLVVLTSASRPVADTLRYNAVVESLAGPDALIRAVRGLLATP